MKLYPGDILESGPNRLRDTYSPTHAESQILVVVECKWEGLAVGVAAAMSDSGDRYELPFLRTDRLVACGAHEDCRASIDLAMSCAAQRLTDAPKLPTPER